MIEYILIKDVSTIIPTEFSRKNHPVVFTYWDGMNHYLFSSINNSIYFTVGIILLHIDY